MVTRVALADLSTLEHLDLGWSTSLVIDQQRIDGFARHTGDRQWIHVDADRASRGPFGATTAHGYLTLSLASRVLLEVLQVDGAGSVINYGLDRVRFPSPVLTGSTIRGHAEVLAVRDLDPGAQVTTRVTLTTAGAARPACVADVLTRFLP